MASELEDLRGELQALADPADALHLQRFFKTGPGEYGEGDRFLGIRVPTLRRLVRKYRTLPIPDAVELLRSPWHEERLLALLILVDAYRRAGESDRVRIFRAYLDHTAYINNWDLVDLSAEHIVGAHLGPAGTDRLEELARSDSLWDRRIAMLSTFHFIKKGQFAPTLRLAEILMHDRHDLIHKAVGWMLREVGKRSRDAEDAFLREHYRAMPRTTLRYAIEHYPEEVRKQFLAGEIP